MKIGISTACLCKNYETEDAFGLIKGLGAETCEVYLRTFYEYRPEFAKKYAERLSGAEVNSIHVAPDNFEPQLFYSKRRERGDGFYWLDQILRSAQLLGAKNYTFHGFARKGGEIEKSDDWARYICEIYDFCARYGIKLCLENVRGCLYNRPSVFKRLKERCSGLSAVFDIKQARKSGYPYQMYLKDMCGAISHVHISDADENGNTCLPSFGKYDFKEIFKQLKGEGFDGAVLIETANFSDIADLKRSVEFLKETADKV
ncbi:MAG: sugar phosphate isomerase/epimerase [Clostridia bacterium]|nr:sugar phosphate isomerase/epimerase [Clostridia bacterium]